MSLTRALVVRRLPDTARRADAARAEFVHTIRDNFRSPSPAFKEVPAEPIGVWVANVVLFQVSEGPQQTAVQEDVIAIALVNAEVEHQPHTAAGVQRLKACRGGHRDHQINAGQHFADWRVIDAEIRGSFFTCEQVLWMVPHAMECVLPRPVTWFEHHLSIGMPGGIAKKSAVNVKPLDPADWHCGLVSEEHASYRTRACGLRCRAEERQAGEQQVLGGKA